MADAAAAAQLHHRLFGRLNEAMVHLSQPVEALKQARVLLADCEETSGDQMASHRAHEQGDARLVRLVLAHLDNSAAQLEFTAELLASALKHALDSGAARDALPVLPHGQSPGQIAGALLALPHASDLHLVPVSVHIAYSCARLAIDHHIRVCASFLRRCGMEPHPLQPHIHQARAYLAWAYALVTAAWGHTFDAVYADMT
ncbi:uncharacterized protein [Aegilops tauschii subsp. strangulata]|uniref:uncharacterized protein isoform X1 n=1 Tax=Aegilops tauschii subsp. strangulata TaxID=200361 RepID=UPI001ABC4681|nr:uncharacterized protein LOC109769493 isoform X1 [Aegilops tauschii subsp. strangulata]